MQDLISRAQMLGAGDAIFQNQVRHRRQLRYSLSLSHTHTHVRLAERLRWGAAITTVYPRVPAPTCATPAHV